jgi:hypothetical protein
VAIASRADVVQKLKDYGCDRILRATVPEDATHAEEAEALISLAIERIRGEFAPGDAEDIVLALVKKNFAS